MPAFAVCNCICNIWVCNHSVFRLFTDDPQLIEMGVDYLEICMVFGLGVFIQIGCERILQSMGKTGLSMVTQLAGAVVNIILDPLMIFGIGPFRKWEWQARHMLR